MSLVKQDRGPSPPPAPIQHRKIRRSDLNIGEGEQDGDLSSHSKSLKSLERQIFMETLRYEQERLQLVRHLFSILKTIKINNILLVFE